MNSVELGRHYLDDVALTFRKQKELADRALAQVDDAAFFRQPDAESNSLALIVKHVAGNQRSRWRDFLTSDGEKADRHRDTEFEAGEADTRAALTARWEEGWKLLFDALSRLGPDDLLREVRIRGEAHTVMQAIQRQVAHYAQHVGQIVFLAKHWAGREWKTLSIPRGKSAEYLAAHGAAVYRPKEGG
jgi:hypothetical protein